MFDGSGGKHGEVSGTWTSWREHFREEDKWQWHILVVTFGVAVAEFGRQVWRKLFETLTLGFVLGQGMLRPSVGSGALGPWKLCFPCLGNVLPLPVVLPV